MSKLNKQLYEFGPFQLDPQDRILYENGERVPLTPKVVETLLALVEGHGRIVEKEDLIKRIWPDTFVEEGNLTVNIFLLRKVIGKRLDGLPCIETIPKRGYRFVAPIKEIEAGSETGLSSGSRGSIPNEPIRSPVVAPFEASSRTNLKEEGTSGAQPSWPPSGGTRAVPRRPPFQFGVWIVLGGALILGAAILLAFNIAGLRERLLGRSASRQIRSIAVLPLQNLSSDASQDYFADEMTDELITELAKVDSLRVISRTSVVGYKGSRKPVPLIGRELNVDAIVEGSVVRSGDRVRITAQLIQASSDQHLWAEAYERDLQDVLGLQSEVARDIAAKIQIKLTRQDELQMANHPVNPAAYEAYLRGRYELTRQDPKAFKEAFAQFQRALEIDPLFPLAYSGLADTYNLFANYGVMEPRDAFPPAEAAANRALELNSSLAEAHASLGFAKNHYDWDWSGAEREYKQAIALSPSYAPAHLRYAELLSILGRHDEALKEVKIAQGLDPLSRVIGSNIGRILYHAHRFDEAIQTLQAVLDLDPKSVYARQTLGMAYDGKGMYADAERELKIVQASMNTGPLDALAHVYARSGRREMARKMLAQLGRENTSWFFNAGVYAALHDNDRAFQELSKAYDNHDFFVAFIKVHPFMDPLRADPRYQALLRRFNMPE